MVPRTITVMGAGMAGLAASLVLARDGHAVTLIERDEVSTAAADEAPTWPRRGIPHFLQPHAFIPRGRVELRRALPDVYAALLAAGAHDVDARTKLPGPLIAADHDAMLQRLLCDLLHHLRVHAVRRAVQGRQRRHLPLLSRVARRHRRRRNHDGGTGSLTTAQFQRRQRARPATAEDRARHDQQPSARHCCRNLRITHEQDPIPHDQRSPQ